MEDYLLIWLFGKMGLFYKGSLWNIWFIQNVGLWPIVDGTAAEDLSSKAGDV